VIVAERIRPGTGDGCQNPALEDQDERRHINVALAAEHLIDKDRPHGVDLDDLAPGQPQSWSGTWHSATT
jgi:hypothetical protein